MPVQRKPSRIGFLRGGNRRSASSQSKVMLGYEIDQAHPGHGRSDAVGRWYDQNAAVGRLQRRVYRKELQDMQKKLVIASVEEPTEWVSSLVVVEKRESGKLRICLDPRDLNRQ